ncbi:hypothetical protein G6L94_31320 [Agrobacterium rhizogenes]|nr:hypothetical protein [Rhizobium rhizogenes]NTI98190.1 hypothetical protein [Rhizobium rhizogenes]NTJ60613.1 hypothetical protein [Rhizobium rhizogenes]OCJ27295.1 hypothetical protein A6U89_29410 [Agrobacterium sp. B133/95]
MLAFAEFDDQGEPYNEKQIEAVRDEMATLLSESTDVIVAVFVHGWRHNGRSSDRDLFHFKNLLAVTAQREANQDRPRPIYGVFVCWRGLSLCGNKFTSFIEWATFWGRQDTARRVSNGSVRELFGYLRSYRNERLRAEHGSPMLVIAGHSFGGLIVYSALEQALIEAASVPATHVVPSFADLVLLINPAFEASRFLPIYRLSKAFKRRTGIEQVPVFVCACANNDQATGRAFPLGNWISAIKQSVIGPLERECRNRTIGHVDKFTTHQLTAGTGINPFTFSPSENSLKLNPSLVGENTQQPNPFWVVRATADVINGHSGIWQPPFISFLEKLLYAKTETTKAGRDGNAREAAGHKGPLAGV